MKRAFSKLYQPTELLIANNIFPKQNNKYNNMKKSILIIATAAFSIFNMNAATEKPTINTSPDTVAITKENIAQVFDWKVETNKGIYSGTALSIEDATAMMALSSSGEIVMGTEIQSYLVLATDISTSRNYFWEVSTETGFAKGYASSEDYAHKMILLVSTGDAIISKMIISQPQQ